MDQLDAAVEMGQQNIVFVDPALSHADMVEHTENVSDALLDNIDLGGVPLVTMAILGFREVRLLKASKTDLRNALKNLSLDVAGTEGGSFIGTSAGAALGTIILPGVGTVIGGLAGSIAGIKGGRVITDAIKRRRLKKLQTKYEAKVKECERRVSSTQQKAQIQFEDARGRVTRELAKTAAARKREIEKHCAELIQERRAYFRLSAKQCDELLEYVLTKLQSHQGRLARAISWARWMPKALLGDAYTAAIRQHRQCAKLRDRLRSTAQTLMGGHPRKELEGKTAAQFLQLLLAVEGTTGKIRRVLGTLERDRKKLEAEWRQRIRTTRETLLDRRH